MAHPPLTVRQRSCLLRAARARLAQLHEDYDHVSSKSGIPADAEVIFDEIGCVTAAIKWLWLQHAVE